VNESDSPKSLKRSMHAIPIKLAIDVRRPRQRKDEEEIGRARKSETRKLSRRRRPAHANVV
jgi:hypothetical protein